MADYLSAFDPVSPVQGVPTPNPTGAAATATQSMENINNNMAETMRSNNAIASQQSMAQGRNITESFNEGTQQSNQRVIAKRHEEAEMARLQEQYRLAAARDAANWDRQTAREDAQQQAARTEAYWQKYFSSQGEAQDAKWYKAAVSAAAGDHLADSISMGLYFNQRSGRGPEDQLLEKSGWATGSQMPGGQPGAAPGGPPGGYAGWLKSLGAMKQEGQDWAEQRAKMNPFGASSIIDSASPDLHKHLSKGLPGVVDLLDSTGNKVGAKILQTMMTNFDVDKPPGPNDLKVVVPGPIAENAMDYLIKLSDEAKAIAAQTDDTTLQKGVSGLLNTIDNMAHKYYNSQGFQNAYHDIVAHDATNGLLDTVYDLNGGKAYVQEKIKRSKDAWDFINNYDRGAQIRMNAEYQLRSSFLMEEINTAIRRGDSGKFQSAQQQLWSLAKEYQGKTGAEPSSTGGPPMMTMQSPASQPAGGSTGGCHRNADGTMTCPGTSGYSPGPKFSGPKIFDAFRRKR